MCAPLRNESRAGTRRITIHKKKGGPMENLGFIVALGVALLVIVVLAKTAVIVPQQNAFVV